MNIFRYAQKGGHPMKKSKGLEKTGDRN